MRAPAIAFGVVVALTALGCEKEQPVVVDVTPAQCTGQLDCPADQVCKDSICQPLTAVGCKLDTDCDAGQKCLSDGSCAQADCEVDADCCPPGTVECPKVCEKTSFKCLGTACADGEAKSCFVGCHKGESVCKLGDWLDCDAAPVLDAEVCDDGIDNDCDGKVDPVAQCPQCTPGEMEDCSGQCGAGTRSCAADGVWTECTGDTECTCNQGETTTRPCGMCGEEAATCSPDGVWSWSPICAGEGECTGAASEEQPCGACGSQTRTCSDMCEWAEWSACSSEGECLPAEEESQACGNCGGQSRICQDDCSWSTWSLCDEDAGCNPGEQQSKSCAKCGVQVSICAAGCEWGQYSACMNQGECTPGEVQEDTDTCGFCGKRTRSCSNKCGWTNWSSCSAMGECEPGNSEEQSCGSSTGLCEPGTQVRSCNGACNWNNWGQCLGGMSATEEICGDGIDQNCDGVDPDKPDAHEVNDSCNTCTDIGHEPDMAVFFGTFDFPGDKVDYFCFTADDGFNLPLTAEVIKVDVTNQTTGLDLDVMLYKGVSNCNSKVVAAASVVQIGSNGDDSLEWKEGNGDDDGTYVIEVRNHGATGCSHSYKLKVHGLH